MNEGERNIPLLVIIHFIYNTIYVKFWSRNKSCVFGGSASLISALLKEILRRLCQSFDKKAA